MNVRDYGAVGDGTIDDSAAISAATAALKPGHTLYFPSGTYRFAQIKPPAGAAIVISNLSDVVVEFGRRAELLMDNLDGGVGSGHGILVTGPASGITLRGVRIRWKTQPAQRSFGDGVRVMGLPAESARPPAGWAASNGPVTDVEILDCEVRSSPQAGVIMLGVSDIRVDGLAVYDTMADGLHFNACRRAKVHNHRAVNTGDDGLALVTYYSEAPSYDARAQTFSFPELNDWTGADFTITNVSISGGRANGVRLAGANRVSIRWLTVAGKRAGAGVIIDSAAPGAAARWYHVSSRGLRLDRVRIKDCETGIHLLARENGGGDRRFTVFEVQATNLTIRDCSNWGVCAESMGVQPATGLRLGSCEVESTARTGGNGGICLANVEDPHLARVSVSHPEPVTLFSASNSTALVADNLSFEITTPAQPDSAAAPCVLIENSGGHIDELKLSWPGAPDSWQPVRIVNGTGDCAEPTGTQQVVVSRLSVEPRVKEPIVNC